MFCLPMTGGLFPHKTGSACTFQAGQSHVTLSEVSVDQPLSVDAIPFYPNDDVNYILNADRFCQSTLSAYAKPFIPISTQPHNPVVGLSNIPFYYCNARSLRSRFTDLHDLLYNHNFQNFVFL